MDRTDSDNSILSGRGSELGSFYQEEAGLYMTSFAATIFIAALVTTGVLLITLLVTLSVMLRSCQNKSTGLIELGKLSEEYHYCKVLALHMELNGLGAHEFPTACKAHAIRYVKEGQYHHELQSTMQLVDGYLNNLVPNDDGLDVVLMDIDDILPTNVQDKRNLLPIRDKLAEEVEHHMPTLLLGLHRKLRNSGYSSILFTRQPEQLRNVTTDNLIVAGFWGWSSLIMRSDDELLIGSWEYISRKRVDLHKQGFRIVSVISSRLDALTGPCLGKQNFKLPNPIFYEAEQQFRSLSMDSAYKF